MDERGKGRGHDLLFLFEALLALSNDLKSEPLQWH